MSSKDWIIAICAVVGATLGVVNFIRTYLTDSERIKIALWAGGQDRHPSVEVINVSPFPITVTEVGHVYNDGQVVPLSIEIKNMEKDMIPRRVEARDSSQFWLSMHATIATNLHYTKYTYVRTALGNIFTSERRLARLWRRALEIAHMKSGDI